MIVKLNSIFKDYLWGGRRLVEKYNKVFNGKILAESWELSCHPDGESIIVTGKDSGISLKEWLKSNPEALGENCKKYNDFPILIKLIDAKQNLSIQVHPDDEYAKLNEGDNGKNEMWYIAEAEENAFIYYGFEKNITKEEYKARIADNTILDVLKKIYVKAGDCFFIKAGTVHAIGEGCLIAEVQQSSNVTYRVYDYARQGADGKFRELHIDKAIEVSILEPSINIATKDDLLVSCEYFIVHDVKCKDQISFTANELSFHSVIILDGNGTIECEDEILEFSKGDSIFISANSGKYLLVGDFHALLTYTNA